MKPYKHKDGSTRLWITDNQMEDLMESELTKAGMMPDLTKPVVDLLAFVEQHLKADFDDYASLDSGTLGETEFRIGTRPKVSINKDLTGAAMDNDESPPGLVGRWRATIAHEATHVLVHRCLYDLRKESKSLFEECESANTAEHEAKRLLRCTKAGVLFRGGSSDWREIQANMGMAALLMPKALFLAAVTQEMQLLQIDRIDRGSAILTDLVAKIAPKFQVSKQAASIRFETLQLLTDKEQKTIL